MPISKPRLVPSSPRSSAQPPLTILLLAIAAAVLSVGALPAQIVGTPCTITGPAVADALHGDLGPAPGGGFIEIACLEIRNDRTFGRTDEVAWSSIPLPESLGLTDTTNLAVIGPGGRHLSAQFTATSRWGGTADDGALPIRWLGVAVQPNAPAGTTVTYSLRRYDAAPGGADGFAATIAPAGDDWTVDTGLATFVLDPSNPALFESISIDLDDDGTGRTQIYTHSSGAGPRLDVGGLTLDTSTPGEVTVDQVDADDDFRVLESGPARVVVAARGHWSDAGGSTLCNAIAPAYEAFGYTVVATFTRGSRDVELRFHVRNECSDAFNAPWDDDARTIQRASWELPFTATPDNAYSAGIGAGIATSPNAFAGVTRVVQAKGAGNPWTRRAQMWRDGADLAAGEALDRPIVAVAGSSIVASLQMPWMQYREPQGIAVDGATLSLRAISEAQLVGEAKGIWSEGLVGLTSTALATARGGGSIEGWVEERRDLGTARLERGLLVRLPLAQVNAAGLFPSLGTAATSTVKTHYETMMARLHDETVRTGGQWDLAKTFGSQLWPEVASRDPFAVENDSPADHPSEYNYWNPTTAEFLEFLRTGDPAWVWEFALPQSRLQAFTAYVNIGEADHGNRNGFAAASGNVRADGQWHRPNCLGTGVCGSADYTYNTGLHLAYALRPDPVLRDRFGQMGRTADGRYDIPQADQDQRERFVNDVDLDRFHMQNFEGLSNCAEMVPGALGQTCHDKLMEIANELVDDNLSAGAMCQADIPEPTRCSQPQQFMKNSMFYQLLMRWYRNYGDIGGGLWRALIEGPESFYTWGAPRLGGGDSIDPDGDWAPVLICDKTAGGADLSNCVIELVDDSPMFFPNRPQTMALLLMAHELDPSVGLCAVARDALDALGDLVFLWDEYALDGNGWIKGPAQMMQSMAFAVGLYDTCDGSQGGNQAPTVTITAPADGTTADDSAALTLVGTATDPEDGNLAATIAWTSNVDGALGTGAAIDVNLTVGAHVLTATVTDSGGLPATDTAMVTITAAGNTAPDVTITAPADGSDFATGASISFAATANDAEDGNLAANLVWTSSLQGAIGAGAAFDVVLQAGTHTVTASVTDSGALEGSDAITVTVTAPGDDPPTATITAPGDGATFMSGALVSFMGAADDTEDGNLTADLVWTSDRDGPIGLGGSFTIGLSVGVHVVTASVTDSGGSTATDTVSVTVLAGGCANGGTLLSEDFDDLTGWTTSGLWHQATNSTCASPGFSSGPNSAYFGQEATCSYDTGVGETGDLISPAIPGIDAASMLTFAYFREVEDFPEEVWDTTEVAVAPDGTENWTVVWQRDSTNASTAAWVTTGEISLAAWAGQTVRVRFRFDSGDEMFNDFVGWMVDDVTVSSPCQTGLFVDGFESGDTSAWADAMP